jgi:hypothetical protein
MTNPWLALQHGEEADARHRIAAEGHQRVTAGGAPPSGLRDVVRASWHRSLRARLDPDRLPAAEPWDDGRLAEVRAASPLASARPVVQRLLVEPASDAGIVVAIGDAAGRLLWVDGDTALRRRAEAMRFVPGTDWSEDAVGFTAPGAALRLDHGIQVLGEEHFNRWVHRGSCTAAPVHGLDGRTVIGVLDITGGDDVTGPQAMTLVSATVAAVEAELRLAALREGPVAVAPPRRRPTRLEVLGRDSGLLRGDDGPVPLSPRHAAILTLLAWHPAGLSARRLAELLYDDHDAELTVRAEIVRLRAVLHDAGVGVRIDSRPYRVATPLALDAREVLAAVGRGAHRLALARYAGPLLPSSDAPGIADIRAEVDGVLREAMLENASPQALLAFAQREGLEDDVEVWRECLRLLPAHSPGRALVVAHLERLAPQGA